MNKILRKILICCLSAISFAALTLSAASCGLTDWAAQTFCEHEFNEGEVITPATCSEVGVFGKTCNLCGFVEETEIEKVSHVVTKIEGKPATCSEVGYMSYTACKVCGEEITPKTEISAVGHYLVKEPAVEATCLTEGHTESEYCADCGEIFAKSVVVPAKGHSIVKIESVEPTCTSTGLTVGYGCEICGEVNVAQREIPMLSHVFEDDICKYCGVDDYVGNNEENYNLVKMNSGDEFEKGWYRFVFSENGVSNFVIKGFSYSELELEIIKENSLDFSTNGFEDSFLRGELDYVEVDFNIVETATYVDIYIAPGLTFDLFVYVDDVTVEKIEVPFSSNVYLDGIYTSGSDAFVYRLERVK